MVKILFITFLMCISNAFDLKCSSPYAGGNVSYITDGAGNRRCFASITPPNRKPMPILFWFHGSGGNAADCGYHKGPEHKSWGDYATEQGFVFICGEAIDGKWSIPEIITNKTGTPCTSNGSIEVDYMKNIITELNKTPEIYDTSRIFTSGCSMGSAFSIYSSICIHTWYPTAITSFMTHSTGLKIKGDGLNFPPDMHDTKYRWGECPKCEYFPARVPIKALDPPLKACIFDNMEDPSDNNPYFYKSSLQLESHWKLAGNPSESHYAHGGHCQMHSWVAFLNCLDDGTRRLLPNGNIPTPPPTPSVPSPPPTPGPTPSPQCINACNQVCPNLEGKGQTCESCLVEHQQDHIMLDNCPPTPWPVALHYFCYV